MIICRKRRPPALAVAVAVLALSLPALAQTPSSAELEVLRSLPRAERERLLSEFGLEPGVWETPERDVSTPDIVAPREQETSDLERRLAEEPAAVESLEVDSGEQLRRSLDRFVEGVAPLSVDTQLRQFGYELFAGAPTTFAPATDIPVSPDYLIGPGDEVVVQLYGKTSRTATLTVDREGVVAFPDLGPMAVAGLTFREMKEMLAREVEHRMIGVDVSVSMGRLRSIRIFVLGDVFQPGSYTVSGLSTLTNALFASGGVRKIGSLRDVQLKRGGEVVARLDLYDLLLSGDTSGDVRLMPGDVVFVPPVGVLVGVAGEVLRPAVYEVDEGTTVAELLELAGGPTPEALGDLLQLERVESVGRTTYDLSLAATGLWTVQDGDLIKVYRVPDREEHVVFLTGNVMRPGKRQHFDGMRVLDLVPDPEALLPETFFDYALLERENPLTREPEYVGFDLGAALLDSLPEANLELEARDRLYVFNRASFRDAPRVAVRGEVREPGTYVHRKDMRVLDLVLAAGGLTDDAWLSEAEVFRTFVPSMRVDRIAVDLAAVLDGDEEANIELRDLDELAVHSVWEFRGEEEVQVLGEVNKPGKFPLFEGMRVSDLIFAGGNLTESAYRDHAELTRYEVVDGERRRLRHVPVDLGAILDGNPYEDLLLQPYDRLLVRRLSNWRSDEMVTVSGEVAFPGKYPIEEGEHLSSLVERFGGFLDDAYLPAAVFRRTEVRSLQRRQLDRLADQLEADLSRLSVSPSRSSASDASRRQAALEAGAELAMKLRDIEATGRMVITLKEADDLADSDGDIVLVDGDHLHVPKRPAFVMVIGQVNNPTAFQYDPGRSINHYIRLAGGTTRFADRGRTYVVRADGSVDTRARRAKPGDVIVVPETLERFGGMQFMLDISQVLYQIGLAAASAHTVGLFD
jgi:polysaccharide export outer membrane protein